MGKTYDEITSELNAWIAAQRMFFVASAPLAESGHVNCSPKGGDSFRVLGSREVAYVDLTGSGIETIAHLRENGRIVVMFCAFEGGPKIVRLHGRGEVVEPGDGMFESLKAHFPALPGLRAIIRIEVSRISDSCGYAVPRYEFIEPRDVLDKWAVANGTDGLLDYRLQKNRASLDGLPTLRNW